MSLLGHVIDVPFAVSIDATQHVFQQRRVVSIGNHKVETKRNARARLLDESGVVGKLIEWDTCKLGEQVLRLRMSFEMSDKNYLKKSLVSILIIKKNNLINRVLTRVACVFEWRGCP